MSIMLSGYAYRINLDWAMFALPGLILLVFALVTMGYQTIKAALANPVKALRYE